MGTIKQNQDLETTWNINTSNDKYILDDNAEIITEGEAAIVVAADANNNKITIRGKVDATDTSNVVNIFGGNTSMNVVLGGAIGNFNTNVGISAGSATSFSLDNAGSIEGKSSAVAVGDYAEITNSGVMMGGQMGLFAGEGLSLTNSFHISGNTYGLLADADGTVINNLKGGSIYSGGTAIGLSNEGTAIINNAGKITGDVAINDGAADTTVNNTGKIVGDVHLGDGDDVFNTRNGTFEGVVQGGDGDDTYIVGKSDTQIVEGMLNGYDLVKSTASFTLGANLEDLTLQGKGDIDGTGNVGANVMTGNKGDNVLMGMGGADYLAGGRGNDILFGGTEGDMFEFNKNTGHDVIKDFVNGEDVIFSHFADDGPSIQDLIDNHAEAKNGGVMITYGDDTLFIKGMTMNQLDESDFFSGL